MYHALLMRESIPLEAREAYYIVELNTAPSLAENEGMPQALIEKILAYKMVKNAIENGLEVNL